MASFEMALKKLWQLEYSGDIKKALHTVNGDSGGMTYKGIARAKNPKWEGWQIIDAKPNPVTLEKNASLQELVTLFYKREFWDKIKGSDIGSQQVATKVFCTAVNIGVKKCVEILQKIVGAEVDGIFGPKTLKALNVMDATNFLERFSEELVEYYNRIVARDPEKRKFLAGWINRAEA